MLDFPATQLKELIDLFQSTNPTKFEKKDIVRFGRISFGMLLIVRHGTPSAEMFRDVDAWSTRRLLPCFNELVDLFQKYLPLKAPFVCKTKGCPAPHDLPFDGITLTGVLPRAATKKPMPAGRVKSALFPKKH